MISPSRIVAIAKRQGLQSPTSVPQPWAGATSRVYPIGDAVLKVSLDTPDAIWSLRIDAAMAPFAVSLGLAAPVLVALDETCAIVPVP